MTSASATDLAGATAVPGTVVGVRLSRPAVDLNALRGRIRSLAQRVPACPVVVLLALPPEEALPLAARLAPLRPRAVVPVGASMLPALREALTDPDALPEGAVEWLGLRGVRLNPNLSDLLQRILAAVWDHADLGHLLGTLHVPASSARFRLRKRRLPPPGQWFQLARALHAALLLQREPERSVESVAAGFGFVDHSAVVHLLRRSFGVGAREVRATLGWEWLLDRWWTAHRSPAAGA